MCTQNKQRMRRHCQWQSTAFKQSRARDFPCSTVSDCCGDWAQQVVDAACRTVGPVGHCSAPTLAPPVHTCVDTNRKSGCSVYTPLYDPSRGSLSLGHDDPWPKYGIYAREMLPARSSESIHTPTEVFQYRLKFTSGASLKVTQNPKCSKLL